MRPPRPCVLIVCEGEKTEPTYFKDLRRDRRLSAAEVEICGKECASHPRLVVDYALKRKREEKRAKLPYDSVWCVFDQDDHKKIEEALIRARDNEIQVAFSNPCFELWYLLHFEYSTAERHRDAVVSLLKNGHLPGYDKSESVYHSLLEHQECATQNAGRLRQHHSTAGNKETQNPSTSVDRLVTDLNSLADRQAAN